MDKDKENRLYEELKRLRLNLSRDFNLKPYQIFNNEELEKLIETFPTSIETLQDLNFISSKKIKSFGMQIIKLFKLYSDNLNTDDLNNKMNSLISKVSFPEVPANFDEKKVNPSHLHFAREIKLNGEFSHSGKFFSDKMKKEIFFESELERKFFLVLEKNVNVKYYFVQPCKIEYDTTYTFNNNKVFKKKVYYPDILIVFNDYSQCFVEVKNYYHLVNINSMIKLNLLKTIMNEKGIGYLISTNYQHTLEEAISYNYNSSIFNQLLSLMKNSGNFSERDFIRLQTKSKIKKQEILPFCYQNNICLENKVFSKYHVKNINLKRIVFTFIC